MTDLVTIIRAIVRDELKSLRLGDIGVVTSSFPRKVNEKGEALDNNNYECNLKMRNEDLELRKVPIATPHIGMASAPEVGDLVLVSYVGGDPNQPIVVGRLYSGMKLSPGHQAGEWRVESPLAGDASITLDKDHHVVIKAGTTTVTVKKSDSVELKTTKDLTVQCDGNVAIKCKDAKIEASGNIDLGNDGAGVITTASHKCYFTGAALIGSNTVKAKK